MGELARSAAVVLRVRYGGIGAVGTVGDAADVRGSLGLFVFIRTRVSATDACSLLLTCDVLRSGVDTLCSAAFSGGAGLYIKARSSTMSATREVMLGKAASPLRYRLTYFLRSRIAACSSSWGGKLGWGM